MAQVRRHTAIRRQAARVFFRLLCLALAFFPTAAFAAEALRVLFIGNSYTAQNNLPGLFSDIVASTGEPRPMVKSRTPGGRTLRQHLGDPETLKLVDAGDWNVMVLQAQSQEPAMAEVNAGIASDFLEGGTGLCRRFQAGNPGGRILLYQTWARHADLWRVDQRAEALGADAAAMQSRNRKWYAALADRVPNATVAPVGDAWERNAGLPMPMRLHGNDHSHPTLAGSYLAALVLYGIVYKPATLDVPFRAALPESEATVLQSLAAETLGDVTKRPQP
jgi:hypothetical protein